MLYYVIIFPPPPALAARQLGRTRYQLHNKAAAPAQIF